MGIKGKIEDDHIPVNKYELIVPGLPPLIFTAVSAIEDELDTVEMPDRSPRSGGVTKPVEFTAVQPAHHTIEVLAMEAWFLESETMLPTYRKAASLVMSSGSGNTLKTTSLINIFPSKKALPDLDMGNEGDMAAITWTFKADSALPL